MGTLRHKAVTYGPSSRRDLSPGFSHHPQAWSNTAGLSEQRGEVVRSFLQRPLGSFLGCRGQGFQGSGQVPGKQGGCWYKCLLMNVPGTHVLEHLATRTWAYMCTAGLQERVQ